MYRKHSRTKQRPVFFFEIGSYLQYQKKSSKIILQSFCTLNSDYIEKYQLSRKKFSVKSCIFIYRKEFLTFQNQNSNFLFSLKILGFPIQNKLEIIYTGILHFKVKIYQKLTKILEKRSPKKSCLFMLVQKTFFNIVEKKNYLFFCPKMLKNVFYT